VPQAFRHNTLKRFNQPMWRGGNGEWIDTTHKGDLFAWLSLTVTASPAIVALPMTIWDTPIPSNVHSWFWALVRVPFHRTKPPKPRCEASCRGRRGTGVVISQCLQQFPRGTGRHPVDFMRSTSMGRNGWRHLDPHYSW
jgi:hypothetical protein